MAMKKTWTLGFKLSIVIWIFSLLVLSSCAVLTYINQMSIYRQQCETDVQNVGKYLGELMEASGEDFLTYQAYYLEHSNEVNVPVDAQEYESYRTNYEHLFHTTYPGKRLGVDITFDELNDEVKHAYLVSRHLYWFLTFEKARESFDLSYVYYIVPDSETDSDIYVIDGIRTSRADHIAFVAEYPIYGIYENPQGDEAEYMYLGDQIACDRKKYHVKWAVWESGEEQTDFQEWDNEFGKTYACYVPLVIDGQKLGLVATEIDIARVNLAILHNTLRQFFVIGLILTLGLRLMVFFIDRRYIRKIASLEHNVRLFGRNKDASVIENIRSDIHGNDEVDSLAEGVAQMIEEIQDYVTNLMKMHQELDQANTNAAKMSELALKDGLTGIRNRTAYGQEAAILDERLAKEDLEFAIVMIDLNDLKGINDTYGHDRGNEAIIRLSKMVCDTFKNSMVFRIGGDEFEAILLQDDYKNREALISQLYTELDQLKHDNTRRPWEKISAAIGLATYEKGKDTKVEDVFRRADAKMYEKKKKMKTRR